MCSGVWEHISAKGEEKSYFKGRQKEDRLLYRVVLFMPQYGSVKKILNMHLHCTGVSCEEGANSYFCFPDFWLEINRRTLTEACAAFRASEGRYKCVWKHGGCFLLGSFNVVVAKLLIHCLFKVPTHCFTAYSSIRASVQYRQHSPLSCIPQCIGWGRACSEHSREVEKSCYCR